MLKRLSEYNNIEQYMAHLNSLYEEGAFMLINKRFTYEDTLAWHRNKVEKEIKKKLIGYVYVDDNKLLGLCFIIVRQSFMSHTAKLYISVSREHRRKGIGTLLLNALEKQAKNEGIEIIELDVVDKNKEAINFYIKNGFNITCTLKKRYKKNNVYFDLIRMEKSL